MTQTIVPLVTTPPPARTRARATSPGAPVVRLALSRIRGSAVRVIEGDTETVFGEPAGTPIPTLWVWTPAAYTALLREGGVGLGAGYIDGWWSADDLTEVLRVAIKGLEQLQAAQPVKLPKLRRGELASKDVARRNIRAHYDLSNDFFELFLDPTMTYSSAVFASPTTPLEEASREKLDRMCRKLDLQATDHVIEIGTGWGSFAIHAASTYGCRVTTTTISREQFEFATARVRDAGLADRVTVLHDDYRDLTGTYDKLVSIEMIEAVDWRLHDDFFAVCDSLLVPGGQAAFQAIVIDDALFQASKHKVDFIKQYIFPGGCLPSVSALTASASTAGMRMVDLEDIGGHYAETLARWAENLEKNDADVDALGLGDAFRRMWEFYLSYCEAGFRERRVSCVQAVFAKGAWRAGDLSLRTA